MVKLSLIIASRDANDPKLADLLKSISTQTFPKDELETLVITEGTSESAKAIGIRRAKGNVVGILASDNELVDKGFLRDLYQNALYQGAAYPMKYYHSKDDDVLNRYFSLIGGNDPLSFYMGKNDKISYLGYGMFNKHGSIGDNGYFIRKDLIEKTNLNNYYHVDNALEAMALTAVLPHKIWHKTGGNILTFFKKRYRYGLQHAFNPNRRWHLVNFRRKEDICRIVWFVIASLTVIHPLVTSVRGYLKVRDLAWFLHPLTCLMTLLTYFVLMTHVGCNRLCRLLFAPTGARRA